MNRLENKVAVITGGASGIGAATARRFVEEGAKVTIADIDAERGNAIAAALGEQCQFVLGDHCDRADCRTVVDRTLSRWGQLDVLFNNAGRALVCDFHTCTDEELANLLDVDLIGAWRMSQEALPALQETARRLPRTGPAIVFTSSGLGLHARPKAAAYTVAKHGIIGLMRSLAQEYGPENIRVNAVCPGYVDTPLGRSSTAGWSSDPASVVAQFQREAPLRRVAEAVDIANAVVFLASDEAKSIHSHALVVDGGSHGV